MKDLQHKSVVFGKTDTARVAVMKLTTAAIFIKYQHTVGKKTVRVLITFSKINLYL
jgi:hypothetical protein